MTKIQLRFILEILGRPPQHISEGLKLLVNEMKNEPGIKLLEETHHPPIAVKDSKDLYTTFTEVILEVPDMAHVSDLMFKYLPSNVEILSPEELIISNRDLTILATSITQKMHQYDSVTKRMLSERDFALSKLKEYAPHLFKKPENTQAPQSPQVQPAPETVQPQKKESKKSKKKSKKN